MPPAAAQSSVKLFGQIDLGVRYVKNDQATWQLADGGMNNSRLVFAGNEDLGGGLYADFWLEGGIGADTGTGSISFGDGLGPQSGFEFSRRATVGLSSAAGGVRLGRDYTPTFLNLAVFDPFGVVGIGSAASLFIAAEIRGIVGANAAYGTLVRANNSVQYIAPNGLFGPGLYGNAMVAAGEDAAANKYVGGRIGYADEVFNGALAYSSTDVDSSGAVTMANFNVGASVRVIGLKVSGYFGRIDLDGLSAGDAWQQNWFIGVRRQGKLWSDQARRHRRRQQRQATGPGPGLQPVEAHGALRHRLVDRQRQHRLWRVAHCCSRAPPSPICWDKPGPMAIASGTDISTGSRFAFFQNDFDLICSNLDTVRLSRAAATSSAVPVVLSAITFNNYGGTCNYQDPPWVKDVADAKTRARPSARAFQRYVEMEAFQDGANRPYLHLVDGGVSDNIGVRGVMESLEELAASAAFRGQVGFGIVNRIVLVIVNSRSSPATEWDRSESPPGLVGQLLQSTGVPIDRYSFETVETMKDRAEIMKWRRELPIARARLAGATEAQAEAKVPNISLEVIDVSFEALPDAKERASFMNLPTSFVLPPEDVDRLREVGGWLLRQSPGYEGVLREIGSAP